MGNLIQDEEAAKKYSHIAIFRLAPQDYHRFHAPVAAIVGDRKDITGNLYTVNPMAVKEYRRPHVPPNFPPHLLLSTPPMSSFLLPFFSKFLPSISSIPSLPIYSSLSITTPILISETSVSSPKTNAQSSTSKPVSPPP